VLGESDARAIYDAQVVFDASPTIGEALATIENTAAERSLTLYISPNEEVYLSAVPEGNDLLRLSGHYYVTDVIYPIAGSARVKNDPAAEMIAGTFDTENRTFAPSSFTMQRSTSLSAERFAGRYEVTFDGYPPAEKRVSRANLALEVGPRGFALAGDSPYVREGGAGAGTITTGECLIGPEGHVRCSALYFGDDSRIVTPLRLIGVLSLGTGSTASGAGRFQIGYDPPYDLYVQGEWNAVRIADR